jgi:hypothetical protein
MDKPSVLANMPKKVHTFITICGKSNKRIIFILAWSIKIPSCDPIISLSTPKIDI